MILWQGHEAEAYKISSAQNTEVGLAYDGQFDRTGMRAGYGGSGDLYSAPDFAPQNDIWHRFRHNDQSSPNEIVWAAVNAAGTKVAQIIVTGFGGPAKYQTLVGGFMVDVGVPFVFQPNGSTTRFDIHHKAGNPGRVEVYYGAEGSQTKVVDAVLDTSGAGGIVRIYHGCNTTGGGYNTAVAEEVVQTTPTLATTSEVKPPLSQGTDADGTGTYADVNEQTYNDANFVALNAVGQHQSYKSAARAHTQNVVSGITLSCRAWYESGGPTSIKAYLKIGGVRYYGPAMVLDFIPLGYQYTFQSNPATGAAFTTAEANDANLEWGWEAAA